MGQGGGVRWDGKDGMCEGVCLGGCTECIETFDVRLCLILV